MWKTFYKALSFSTEEPNEINQRFVFSGHLMPDTIAQYLKLLVQNEKQVFSAVYSK